MIFAVKYDHVGSGVIPVSYTHLDVYKRQPLLTGASPDIGPGINATLVGTVRRPDGETQVTYDHRPLYLYDDEIIRLNASNRLVRDGSVGNGSGQRGPNGVTEVLTISK